MNDTARYLDALSGEEARRALLRCCASRRWVEAMLTLRPFEEDRALFEAAERFWWSLAEDDWLEAFAAHPRLGESALADRHSRSEQAGARGADPAVLEALAAGNRAYEERFGFVFLLSATGLTADDMRAALETRLERSRDEELETAAAEQATITRLRLSRLADAPDRVEDGSEATEKGSRMGISTHVLDTAHGRPAAGVRVTLERTDGEGGWDLVFEGETDADGRIASLLPAGEGGAGVYRVRFETGPYFARHDVAAFHPHAAVTFTVDDPDDHYHVPLLASPFGFTTYRGS